MNATTVINLVGQGLVQQSTFLGQEKLSTKLFYQLIMKVYETSIGQKMNYTGTGNCQPVIGTGIQSTYSFTFHLFYLLHSGTIAIKILGVKFFNNDLTNQCTRGITLRIAKKPTDTQIIVIIIID